MVTQTRTCLLYGTQAGMLHSSATTGHLKKKKKARKKIKQKPEQHFITVWPVDLTAAAAAAVVQCLGCQHFSHIHC